MLHVRSPRVIARSRGTGDSVSQTLEPRDVVSTLFMDAWEGLDEDESRDPQVESREEFVLVRREREGKG